jgi:hypothetical protein
MIGVFIPTHVAHADVIGWLAGFVFDDLLTRIISPIFQAILYLVSWITGISGLLLNFVLRETVLKMSQKINKTG